MSQSSNTHGEQHEPSALRTPEGMLWLALAEFLLVGLGYLIRIAFPRQEPPFRLLTWQGWSDLRGAGIGIALGLLLFLGDYFTDHLHWSPLKKIRLFLKRTLQDALAQCSFSHIFVVGLSAGLCEEYLFRGVLEPRIGFWFSNLLFAALHPHSTLYLLIAFSIGGIMSLSVTLTGSLWTAIVAHAVYDMAILRKMASQCR